MLCNAENLLFSDDFSYSNAFSLHGWQYSAGACGSDPAIPVNDSFGLNASNSGCGFAYNRFIRRDVAAFTNSTLNVTWAYNDGIDGTNLNNRLTLSLKTSNASSTDTLSVIFDPHGFINFTSTFSGFVACHPDILSDGYHYYNFFADFPNKRYYFYVDNFVRCSGNVLSNSQIPAMKGLSLTQGVDDNESIQQLLDYIILTNESSVSLLPVDTPCSNNLNCSTGYCLNGLCSFKWASMACASNLECSSNSCVNGFCSRDSLSSGLTRAKNSLVGGDEASSNIISFILMLIFSFGAAAITFGLGIMLAGFAFLVVFILSGFLFAFIGWLSGWLIFGLIFMLLIGIVMLIFFRGSGDSG